MEIIEMLLTPNPYSRPQTKLKSVTKIAVHYVGNPGTTALANRNYFNNLATTHTTYASSHYIIGLEGEIVRCIPESEISYATNSANSYSISIECCHPDSTGKFSDKTYNSLVELCSDICNRYNLSPVNDIIRHYDITKKLCPKWWSPGGGNSNANKDFNEFKQKVQNFKEDDDMTVDEVKTIVNQAIADNQEKVYNSVDEVPDWGKATVEKLVDKGALQGSDDGLDVGYELLRQLVINDRMGLYD